MKTQTPKYRMEASYISFANRRREFLSLEWNCKQDGRPTVQNLERYRKAFNASLNAGGTNEHLQGVMSGFSRCKIVVQKTGEVIAEFNPPAFEQI